jgi:pimeloyl-ACP methyl ester carboxylesterase
MVQGRERLAGIESAPTWLPPRFFPTERGAVAYAPRLASILPLLFSTACVHASSVDANIPVGALSIHMVCRGEGEPVVVLDSGLGAPGAMAWAPVQDDVAKTTRVCAYDRAGLGSSSAAPRPHTHRMMVDELAGALAAAGVKGPYVLVGHSMGGLNVRMFASRAPDAVAGVVLVDAMSESQPSRYWSLFSEDDMAQFRAALPELPEGVDFDTLTQGLSELKSVGTLGDKPLVVLSHAVEDPPPGTSTDTAARMLSAWQSMQEDLAQLSTNSAYLVIEGAHHAIPHDRPDVVAAAIREVLDAARTHRPVQAAALTGAPRPAE